MLHTTYLYSVMRMILNYTCQSWYIYKVFIILNVICLILKFEAYFINVIILVLIFGIVIVIIIIIIIIHWLLLHLNLYFQFMPLFCVL